MHETSLWKNGDWRTSVLYLEMTNSRHFRTWSKWWQKTLDQSQRGWRTSGIYTVIVAISYCYCYCLHQDIRYLHCYCCNVLWLLFISEHQVFTLLLLQLFLRYCYCLHQADGVKKVSKASEHRHRLLQACWFQHCRAGIVSFVISIVSRVSILCVKLADFNIVEQVSSAF